MPLNKIYHNHVFFCQLCKVSWPGWSGCPRTWDAGCTVLTAALSHGWGFWRKTLRTIEQYSIYCTWYPLTFRHCSFINNYYVGHILQVNLLKHLTQKYWLSVCLDVSFYWISGKFSLGTVWNNVFLCWVFFLKKQKKPKAKTKQNSKTLTTISAKLTSGGTEWPKRSNTEEVFVVISVIRGNHNCWTHFLWRLHPISTHL